MQKHNIYYAIVMLLALLVGTSVAQGKVIYTGELGKKVYGYNGPVPLKITIENGRIKNIEAEKNGESPAYFKKATSKIFPQYIGKTVEQGLKFKVDAVTGATYSSEAIIKNIQLGLQQESKSAKTSKKAAKKSGKKTSKKKSGKKK